MCKFILLLGISFIILASVSCGTKEDKATTVIQRAIEAHGGSGYDTLDLRFRFRDRHYVIDKKGGLYQYTRLFTDSTGRKIVDVLQNNGFERTIDNELQTLPLKEVNAYSNALNSVVYFALLPIGLNDAAVIKKHKGEHDVKGKTYHLIEVSFVEEGGGADFEDVFLYWIDVDSYFIDYLAYSFHVDGGGVRFREAVNRRKSGNIYLQDYINYKPTNPETSLDSLMTLFEQNQLEKLSEINLIE